MNVDFKGFGENAATFVADATLYQPGVAVKITDDGKASKCNANDKFCGICLGVRDGYATVQLKGYAEFKASSKIAVGYQKLAATAAGGAGGRPSAVVVSPLVVVRQHVVGLVERLELLFRIR